MSIASEPGIDIDSLFDGVLLLLLFVFFVVVVVVVFFSELFVTTRQLCFIYEHCLVFG